MFGLRSLFGLGGALLLILFIGYISYGLGPRQESEGNPVSSPFEVVRGEGLREISARLSQQSLIKSITVFKLYALFTGNARKLKPGVYEFTSAMSAPEIISALTRGGANEVTVTIPEGTALKDIDATLSGLGVLPRGSLLAFPIETVRGRYAFLEETSALEGFFFPDTYRFERGTDPLSVVQSGLDTFERKAWPVLKEIPRWYDTLILASFLEKEITSFTDRQIVAGIVLKRLDRGMPLQVDATLVYAKCDGKLTDCTALMVTKEDTRMVSPYNTYNRSGFTPTPINNPGVATLTAASTPAHNPYLYYLSARETKETLFSKTLEEHNRKRAKYL